MTHFKTYPFTAIVGQDLMKLALILNAINPKIGGVLIKGTKGTAKSTAVRALADLLPEINVIKDCSFNCNPNNLKESCHACQHKILENKLDENNIESRKMRVINLPINATEDRVVGTIDIKKALEEGLKALEPGILAEANRNILYIDEVNLLADNVADVLLDSAAMGINIIEREGISIHHPSNFILVGTMNPEEGNLRPQLLDRFGLSVEAKPILEIDKRVQIIKYAEQYHIDPHEFHDRFEHEQKLLREKIVKARKIIDKVQISEDQLNKIAQLSVQLEIDSHRADITINLTAKTIAAFNGREDVNENDIKTAAKLALAHRVRKLPFEENIIDENEIDNMFNEQEKKEDKVRPPSESKELKEDIITNTKERIFGINNSINANNVLDKKRIKKKMNTSGQRLLHPTQDKKGKYVSGQKPKNFNFATSSDIAVLQTLNTAALESENKEAIKNGNKLNVKREHIHTKKRVGKSSYLIIFCVDASGSMGANDRMEAVKGVIFSLLQSNYVYRDKVSLVVFRGEKAKVVLPPTRSTDLAYKLLKEIPTGGTTPLVTGLSKALRIALEEKRKNTGYIPLIILISDARGNVYFNDPFKDIINIGKEIRKNNLDMIIIDTEATDVKIGINKKLADEANALYYHISNMNQESVSNVLEAEGLVNLKL
ncbi:MAG: VWA domain-containing protein [Promethearchaeota archaeon]|nr:MAG: VWA domain-containing protein [Candidatus Lokiarchaeota archaeon]